MKHKLRKVLLVLVLMFGFMINVNAETKIKENADSYSGDVYIIGSSRFDSSIIITGTMATVAGARESYIQYVVNDNYDFNPEDVRIYYYSELAETWSVLPVTSEDKMTELTEEETEKLIDNLNIYYVNEEEKVLELPYNVILEDGYELVFYSNDEKNDERITYENGKLNIPATVRWFEIYAANESNPEEEIQLGNVSQSEGVFENDFSIVRTYEQLKLAYDAGVEYINIEESIDLPTALKINRRLEIYMDFGVELTVTKDTAGDGVFHVVEGGNLTINGNGTINGVGDNKWNIVIFADGGDVTINGGTYTNENLVVRPEDTDSAHFDVIYAKQDSKVVINDGRFVGKTPAWLLNIHDGSRATASIEVKGGIFVGFNPADNKAEGEGTNFLAEGTFVEKTFEGYQARGVFERDVAVIENVIYATLSEAIVFVNENETIKLIRDIDLPTALEISKKVTIDLNGHNLTVTKDTAGDGVFHVIEGGNLTINGEGIVDGTGDNKWNIVIFAEGGDVTINGGTYTNKNLVVRPEDTDSAHFDVIYAKLDSKVVINGGHFEGKTPAWLLNIHDGSRATASIEVKGGTFDGFNPADNEAEGKGTNFVAEGYNVVKTEEVYEVKKNN